MKKNSYILTAVILVLCFLISSSFLWWDDCKAYVTIYNKLPSIITVITVTIDGTSKQLAPWGSCTDLAEDGTDQIVPCSQTWEIGWDSTLSLFPNFCTSLTEEDEDESAYEDDHEYWEEEEEEEVCDDYTVAIKFKGVKGLDRSLTLSDDDQYNFLLSTAGFKHITTSNNGFTGALIEDVFSWP